jgi:hypothetical protein
VGPTDSGVEAAPIEDAPVDSTPAVLTVIVGGPFGPEQGIPVVWSDSSGAVVATSTTDASGAASTVAPSVSTLTVVMGTVAAPALYTAEGVSLGQTIVVADESSLVQTTYPVNVTSVPTSPTLGDGGPLNEVEVNGTCGGSAVGAQINLGTGQDDQACIGVFEAAGAVHAGFPLLVIAEDSLDNELGYAFSNTNGLVSPDGGDDGGPIDVALGGTWQTTETSQTVSALATDAGLASQVLFSEVADDVLNPLQGSTPPDDAGPGALVFRTHPGFASAVQAEADYFYSTGIGGTVIASSSPPPTTSGTITLDTSAAGTAPVFASVTPSFTGAQPTISWTMSSGTVASATVLVAVTSWNAEIDGGGTQSGKWTIVSPGIAGSTLTAPLLPAALSAYRQQGSESYGGTLVTAVEGGSALPSYASALPMTSLLQLENFACGMPIPAAPPIPGVGTVVFAMIGDSDGC